MVRLEKMDSGHQNTEGVKDPVVLYAISCTNEKKGIIEDITEREGAKVVEGFLRNVDSKNSVTEFYSA